MTTKDAAPVGPSVVYSRQNPSWRRHRSAKLCERQVVVTNPDGSKTTHTFWSDKHYDPHID